MFADSHIWGHWIGLCSMAALSVSLPVTQFGWVQPPTVVFLLIHELWSLETQTHPSMSFTQWPAVCISDSAGNLMALCALNSSSWSGDLPNSPASTYSSTAWMNVWICFCVLSDLLETDFLPAVLFWVFVPHRLIVFTIISTSESFFKTIKVLRWPPQPALQLSQYPEPLHFPGKIIHLWPHGEEWRGSGGGGREQRA